MYQVSDYDFPLPEKQIAQKPNIDRDQSKLLVLNRKSGQISHLSFFQLLDLLSPSDLLVVNNTKVIPGRLFGRKETGGQVELLILDYAGGLHGHDRENTFECPCLIKASKRPKVGSLLSFDMNLKAEVIEFKEGIHIVRFWFTGHFDQILDRIGQVPLPPYIKRGNNSTAWNDRNTYQTVYAEEKGAIAAPTAGLHFTPQLIEKIKLKNIPLVEITLHVGYGTFLPIRTNDIRDHKMHAERFSISKQAADTINQKKKENARIIAVGTTSVRTIEFATNQDGLIRHGSGICDLFIYPGYQFQTVKSMITNFHLPKSSLIMLVSAFADRSTILSAYQEAINNGYRFFSYGDAMFII
ncbi:MAG: tRNA preQ1(34) S-adenosylmethionine ribosyltransferase-isomerase QueA [Desulfobacteraceae bacterium]|nr:MAG: tRNA preQ1(34) S-adenosylmethionine ribosyltransferase-isomerase QueA [Desulfobacteraceae bacterium]